MCESKLNNLHIPVKGCVKKVREAKWMKKELRRSERKRSRRS